MRKPLILLLIVIIFANPVHLHSRSRRAIFGQSESAGHSVVISGLRVESDSGTESHGGILQIIADDDAKVRLFGRGISNATNIKFTTAPAPRGTPCGPLLGNGFNVTVDGDGFPGDSGWVTVKLDLLKDKSAAYHLCVQNHSSEDWYHQGNSPHLQIRAVDRYLIPLWIQILLVITLQCLSGLFSGLNLGLLSLDPTELQIVASVGASKEKKYAKHIIPLRRQGNFLLCSLVIGNVLVNSLLTILLDNLTSGLYAVIFSTIGIVLFGEIVPQALCNRYGLAIGSATRYITYVVMGLTCIISWPLSKLLDFLLGREIGTVYDRERLVELIRVTMDHNLLENDEVNIISGALSLKRKKVRDIMTTLEDVFMLPYDAVLDFETLSEITREGFTRIPVYEGARTNIVGLLNIKDLALLDPDDCTAVATLCKYYSYELCCVIEDTTLDVMLEEFKKGSSHLAFVQQFISAEDRDPYYETIGIATLEDIIEEMIQSEILDESDKHDADRKKPLKKDLSIFSSRPLYSSLITPQLQHAAFQFLSTSVDPFRGQVISEQILRRLIRHGEVARLIRRKPTDVAPAYIFQAGRPADYFVLILEGRVEVKIGYEGLVFESGPFTYFGVSALILPPDELAHLSKAPFPALPSPRPTSNPRITLERSTTTGVFVPDFTVYAMSDVLFLRIKRAHYVAAIRASNLERSTRSPTAVSGTANGPAGSPAVVEDLFSQEMDRVARDDLGHGGMDFPPALGSQSRLNSITPNSTADLPTLMVNNVKTPSLDSIDQVTEDIELGLMKKS